MRPEQSLDLGLLDCLMLEQEGDELVEKRATQGDRLRGAFQGLPQDSSGFFLDRVDGGVARAPIGRDPLSKEGMLRPVLIEDWAEALAHPEVRHHLERELGCLPEIVLGARRGTTQDARFGRVTTHQHLEPRFDLWLRHEVLVG
jgi:hypothetical protein